MNNLTKQEIRDISKRFEKEARLLRWVANMMLNTSNIEWKKIQNSTGELEEEYVSEIYKLKVIRKLSTLTKNWRLDHIEDLSGRLGKVDL